MTLTSNKTKVPSVSAAPKGDKVKVVTKAVINGEDAKDPSSREQVSEDNDTDASDDAHNTSKEGEIIGLNDLEQMAALASKRNSTFSMEEECSSKRNSQNSADDDAPPAPAPSVKCVRFNMKPEINQFEVLSSQSEAPTDSESERSYAEALSLMERSHPDGHCNGHRSGGPMEVEQDPVDLNTNVDPTEFGVDGPVLVVADVSCQTDDELDDDDDEPGETEPFLSPGSPLETTTEFHDTHQTVYIHRSPQGSPQDDEDVCNMHDAQSQVPHTLGLLRGKKGIFFARYVSCLDSIYYMYSPQ
ncbi:uncharacterized protein [Diadema antillarum]|uniref:uncharacterized protein n=1 Tax=Diadema antillarum TaxID=105358 RepID=UPI003A8AC6C4